jgi:polysaccharide export outer membrane protein
MPRDGNVIYHADKTSPKVFDQAEPELLTGPGGARQWENRSHELISGVRCMRSKADRASLAGLILLVLAGAAWGQTPGTDGHPESARTGQDRLRSDDRYVIGDTDQLEISVWKEPELTKTVPVRTDGKISLPLVGEIQASGRTPLQLEEDIASRLRSFVTQPQVTVIVQQINSEKYNVMGQVTRPGSYPLTITTTVMDAIANAGGFRDFARKKDVHILRARPDGTQTRYRFNYDAFVKGKNPQTNIRLQPGDTIVVN